MGLAMRTWAVTVVQKLYMKMLQNLGITLVQNSTFLGGLANNSTGTTCQDIRHFNRSLYNKFWVTSLQNRTITWAGSHAFRLNTMFPET